MIQLLVIVLTAALTVAIQVLFLTRQSDWQHERQYEAFCSEIPKDADAAEKLVRSSEALGNSEEVKTI